VYFAGATTRLSQASSLFPPKAEKGHETKNTKVPPTVATKPSGLAAMISTTIPSALVFVFSGSFSFVAADANNGENTSATKRKHDSSFFLYLSMKPSFFQIQYKTDNFTNFLWHSIRNVQSVTIGKIVNSAIVPISAFAGSIKIIFSGSHKKIAVSSKTLHQMAAEHTFLFMKNNKIIAINHVHC
jgi:hypothetical protein